MKDSNHRPAFYNSLLKKFVLPVGDRVFGQKMMTRLKYLEEAQWWSPERIQEQRFENLQALIKVAYEEVPLYRQLMLERKVTPQDIGAIEDIRHLPISTKELLRKNYPQKTVRDTGQKTYEACTSGSTGRNFCVLEDAETAGWYRATFLLALEWAGWHLGEPHMQTGMTLTRSLDRKLKDYLLRCHYVSAYDLGDSSLDKTLDLLENKKIRHLWGYPGSIYLLAKHALKRRCNQPLSSIVTWGDSLYAHYRITMIEAFKTRVFDTYGCAEGIQIAAQCKRGNYHIHELDTIVELLDDAGQPVPLGQPGNLIITRLHPGPMPLIRYRVGDIGISGGNQICPCGRGFQILKSIQGRDTDIIHTPSGNRLIVHFFTGVIEHFTEVDSFQVVQEAPDSIVINVVPLPGFSDAVSNKLISTLKEKGARDLDIIVKLTKKISLPPSGKHRFVISKIQKSR